MFVTVEDEHGDANLVVYADIGRRDRAALVGARLLIAEGRVEREDRHAEVPILHLICRRLIDRTELLEQLGAVDGTAEGWARLLARADEVRRPEPGSRRDAAQAATRMQRSRAFR
ncbi:hypothetical protein M0638_23785 [Roseomonas sp. NAR14]|uniref:Uncharacterized protein n=1 Tax=Roseomonas acroporae TaxID=2937791 RepID=A0A9X2BZT1_9PROT|nr:hypothetical protein [Roseomonas acroporae]MCK8787395.1 hypothetical protein [Roseomonas acroporae]